MTDIRTLNATMPNTFASRLGKIAYEAGAQDRKDVGDQIDRGLILLRMLNEAGFVVTADYDSVHP